MTQQMTGGKKCLVQSLEWFGMEAMFHWLKGIGGCDRPELLALFS
jgi:hypothetical protein